MSNFKQYVQIWWGFLTAVRGFPFLCGFPPFIRNFIHIPALEHVQCDSQPRPSAKLCRMLHFCKPWYFEAYFFSRYYYSCPLRDERREIVVCRYLILTHLYPCHAKPRFVLFKKKHCRSWSAGFLQSQVIRIHSFPSEFSTLKLHAYNWNAVC